MAERKQESPSIRHFSPTVLLDATSPVPVLTGFDNSQPLSGRNSGMISVIDSKYMDKYVNVDGDNDDNDDNNTDEDAELISITTNAALDTPKPKPRKQRKKKNISDTDSQKPKARATKPKANKAKTNAKNKTIVDDDNTKKTDGSEDSSIMSDSSKSKYILDLFKFSEENMGLDPIKDVFIQFSRIHDDELVKWHHINCNPNKYICSSESCPTRKGAWRQQPAYLILHRKNNIQRDNRLTNIEYRCPNCYFQDFGPNVFNRVKKGIDTRRRTCANECGRVLTSTYSSRYCYGCQQKIKKYDTGPTVSDLVKLTMALNKVDSDDDDDDPEEMAEKIAAMQSIYSTDLEMEANMRRHGIATNAISGYNKTTSIPTANHCSRISSSKLTNQTIAPDVNIDMTNILSDLDDLDDTDDPQDS